MDSLGGFSWRVRRVSLARCGTITIAGFVIAPL